MISKLAHDQGHKKPRTEILGETRDRLGDAKAERTLGHPRWMTLELKMKSYIKKERSWNSES